MIRKMLKTVFLFINFYLLAKKRTRFLSSCPFGQTLIHSFLIRREKSWVVLGEEGVPAHARGFVTR